MQSDLQIRAGHAEVRCKNGHIVSKQKGELKPWQGVVRRRTCGACGKVIERHEPHWRCEEHCHWDICHGCFDRHWARVIKEANATENNEIRRKLLQAVPEDRRKMADYMDALHRPRPQPPPPRAAAAKYVQSVAKPEQTEAATERSGSEQAYPSAAPKKQVTKKQSARRVSFQEETGLKSKLQKYELHICIATLLVVSPLGLVGQRRLLLLGDPSSLQFPSPWLMVGLVNLLGGLMCKLAAWRLVPKPPPLPPGYPPQPDTEVPWKHASILGVVHCIELGIGGFVVRYNAIGTRNEIYILAPAVLLVAGILSNTEPWLNAKPIAKQSTIAAFACMALGSLLACPSSWEWVSYEQFPLALLSGAAMCLRWIWTNNVFPPVDRGPPIPGPPQPPKSALVLAARMAPATGATGLELTFLTSVSHLGALTAIFKVPNPAAVFGLLFMLACCAALTLLAELRLVQISSMTLLGFLGPLRQTGAVLVLGPLLLGTSWPNLVSLILFIVFCSTGIGLFYYSRTQPLQETSPREQRPRVTTHAMAFAEGEGYYHRMYPQEKNDWV